MVKLVLIRDAVCLLPMTLRPFTAHAAVTNAVQTAKLMTYHFRLSRVLPGEKTALGTPFVKDGIGDTGGSSSHPYS
ncbi:unnamed protein product [Colias eurytheme]|nr:unnamed protein product [Colias eurytheme]